MLTETLIAAIVFGALLAVAIAGLLTASRDADRLHKRRADRALTTYQPTAY